MYGLEETGGLFAGYMAAALITGCISFVIGVGVYILLAIGIQTLAKNRGIENPWLAWIPIANFYLLGKIVGSMEIFGKRLDKLEIWVLVAYGVTVLLSWIPVLGFLIAVALLIFEWFFYTELYKRYKPDQVVLYTILSLFFFPIMIFIIRKNPYIPDAAPVENVQY